MASEREVPIPQVDSGRSPEEDARAAHARLQAVLDAAIDAIITIDRRGVIESVNAAAERMFGWSAGELRGRNVSMLMPSPHREAHDDYIRRYLASGEARIIGVGREVMAQRRDGSTFPCDLAVSEFTLDGERMFTGIIRDVTDRRSAELEARERLEELAHAGRLADLGLTTSTIAHEVKQPLTAIVGFATACQRMLDSAAPRPETLRGALAQIAEQGARASEVIDRIRQLARKREPVVEALDVNDAVQRVLIMLSDEVRLAHVHLDVALGLELPLVRGDRVHVEQVLMNLVRNALEAMRDGDDDARRLAVVTEASGEGVMVTVGDSGPGFGAGYEETVFESFYTTKASGMGVGLAICRTLAEAQGGRLWAEPDRGDGAVFHFTLPAQERP